ncbi:MAG TPA: DegT/DnrJ/EryC1/StrS family aminotransferase [Solirubrobacteraceae bacterium]
MELGEAVPLTRLDNADPELLALVAEIARAGAFTLGEPVEAFERDFADYCEAPYAIGVSSGTEALTLSLRALQVGPGDEVLVPANSFIATAEAVSAVGARPRLVDVDPDTHLITADIVAAALRPAVRAVVPVHLYGATVDLDPILALAREAGVHVVEDACQAHGARYRGRRVGALGALGCFSFYPAKNLGAWGDGGAVVTGDAELAERVALLRSHGERPRYNHRLIGTTARLDALQAAILRHKLARLDERNEERRWLAAELRELLAPVAGPPGAHVNGQGRAGQQAAGATPSVIELPALPCAAADHVYHLFVVRCEERDALREHLAAHGVASAVHYPRPIHLTEAYAHLRQPRESLPACEAHATRICSLPLFPGMGEEELQRVADAVHEFAEGRPRASSRGRL